ncbi:MAG: bifunctional metallophosphatase/5'-nucleotidase [Bacillota bacterium]
MGFLKAKRLFTGFLILVLVMGIAVAAAAEEVNIRIYHHNDTHARVEEGSYAGMGFAKIATLVKEGRREMDNVLYLDAGDAFHGQVIANVNEGEAIAYIFNIMDLDALALGNHDFNYGQERLKELKEISDFPLLAANLKEKDGKDSPLADNYIIKEYDGVRVGIFGLATPETAYKTHPKNVEGLIFADPVESAREMVEELEGKTDVVIGLFHLGLSEGSKYTSKMVAEQVDGIDVIVDGHSHHTLENGMMVNDTLITMAGEYDKNLGVIDLTVEDNAVRSKKASLISKEMAEDVKPDKIISMVVDSMNAANEKITSQVVGTALVELEGDRAVVRTGESNLGNLIADAIRIKLDADAAITNGGGIRASINKGEITKGEVITVLPFGNTAMAVRVKGSDLRAALEHGISEYPAEEGLFPQVSGIKFTFDPEKAAGERIKKVWVKGKELDPDRNYVVATNDFMAAGGDGYTMFKGAPIVKEAGGLEEVVMEYLENRSPVAPELEGRIIAE